MGYSRIIRIALKSGQHILRVEKKYYCNLGNARSGCCWFAFSFVVKLDQLHPTVGRRSVGLALALWQFCLLVSAHFLTLIFAYMYYCLVKWIRKAGFAIAADGPRDFYGIPKNQINHLHCFYLVLMGRHIFCSHFHLMNLPGHLRTLINFDRFPEKNF